ncbi:MAG: 3-beta hydroxysteroid dehydrogenase [Sphingomonas bacterium]|uniref:complex I NDUFA9 subunit family protein n=1 Tax=Sphingomonas bacterium TaxID=1895847 RepID=UPI00260EA38F|nr:complex I NDUFA9 subunit family protein [Sphingomonas bacterium]MDB5695039.1 3-beta hydroxysteroid dehydrogenase [Sphingomonas bacterium]
MTRDALVVVFGGSGFIGRYAAQALMRAGLRVRFAERDPRRAAGLKALGALGQSQFVAADLSRPDTVARALAGADAAVNLVGTFGKAMEAIHVDGARAVAEAAASAGAGALVHVSAIGADPSGAALYAQTKGRGEEAVRAAFPTATILRPSVVFGAEDQFLNRFAGLIARAPVVPVLRAGTRFQPVFVGDVADAIALAVTEPARFGGQMYELGGPDTPTMAELLRWIAAETNRAGRFVELPDFAGSLLASAGFLPGAPITRDQWLMLQKDNVVAPGAQGLAAFDIAPTPMATVAPAWLVRFRRQGRFARPAPERVGSTRDAS